MLSAVEFSELSIDPLIGDSFPDHVILSLVRWTLIDAADVDGDGVIDYEEFVPAMIGLTEAVNEDYPKDH